MMQQTAEPKSSGAVPKSSLTARIFGRVGMREKQPQALRLALRGFVSRRVALVVGLVKVGPVGDRRRQSVGVAALGEVRQRPHRVSG